MFEVEFVVGEDIVALVIVVVGTELDIGNLDEEEAENDTEGDDALHKYVAGVAGVVAAEADFAFACLLAVGYYSKEHHLVFGRYQPLTFLLVSEVAGAN